MAREYVNINTKTFREGLRRFMNLLSVDLLLVSEKSADDFLRYVKGIHDTDLMPVYSGNMFDSTGVGIYQDSSLRMIAPPRSARNAQHYGSIQNIWGYQWLQEAIESGVRDFPKGTWIVIYSAVPYAPKVNEIGSPWKRGIDFFENLKLEIYETVKLNLNVQFPKAKETL